MRRRLLFIVLALATLAGTSSCLMVIRDSAPRWKYSLKYNGTNDSFTCTEDTQPFVQEYSVPEFFVMDDDVIVFRFYDKASGLKLQAGNTGPFINGKTYSFKEGDPFLDVSFQWLYNGKEYTCRSGSMKFSRNILPNIDYKIDFSFELETPAGTRLSITDGVFTAYSKIQPRNTELGLK